MRYRTFCGAEEHVDIVFLERLVDSAIPGRRPGVLDQMSVLMWVIRNRGCTFETVLTGVFCSLEVSVYALLGARINAWADLRGGSSVSALSSLNCISCSRDRTFESSRCSR